MKTLISIAMILAAATTIAQSYKHISEEIIIDATPEQVWAVLIDNNHWNGWNPFIIQSEGEATLGNKIKNTMKNGDSEMVFKPRITVREENQTFEWIGRLMIPGIFDGRHRFELHPTADGKTRLVQSESFKGILSGMIMKKIGEDTTESFRLMNAALKMTAESRALSQAN